MSDLGDLVIDVTLAHTLSTAMLYARASVVIKAAEGFPECTPAWLPDAESKIIQLQRKFESVGEAGVDKVQLTGSERAVVVQHLKEARTVVVRMRFPSWGDDCQTINGLISILGNLPFDPIRHL